MQCQIDIHDRKLLQKYVRLAIKKAGGHIVGKTRYTVFPNGGVTMAIFLKESSVTIHTYKEQNDSLDIDAFTCGKECNPENIIKNFAELLGAKEVTSRYIQVK